MDKDKILLRLGGILGLEDSPEMRKAIKTLMVEIEKDMAE